MIDPNDKIFEDLIVQQLDSLRVDARFRKVILKDLKKLEREIITKLRLSGIEGTGVKKRRLNALLRSVRKSIKQTFFKIDNDFKESVTEYASIEAVRTQKTIESVITVSTTGLTPNKLNSIYSDALIEGSPSKEWWLDQDQKLYKNFRNNIREGLLRGETNQQLTKRIRGSKAFNFKDGVMETSRRDANTLVRSSVQAVANEARFRLMESNDDLIEFYQHVSTLDSSTSDVCIVRDGKRWTAKDKKPVGHNLPFRNPPIHWGCRSTLIMILKGVPLPDDAIRSSIDGGIKASKTFEDFIQDKPKAFLDELLGKGKSELFRTKKITFRQLLDQSGNELTLTQLKQKYL